MNPAVIGLLATHIGAGTVALFSGLVALCSRKGAALHRRFGRVYFWAMCTIAASASVLAPIFHNVFLFLVTILSFYAAFSGYRVLGRKNPFKSPPAAIDWAAAWAVTVSGVVMIVLGLLSPHFIEPDFVPMFIAFGSISMLLGAGSLAGYVRPPQKKGAWILLHAGRMIGSYIAVLTAFSAVNLQILPLLVRWFWPTVLLVPVIVYFNVTQSKKMTASWSVS